MSDSTRRICASICSKGRNRVRVMSIDGIERKEEDGRASKVVSIASRSDNNPAVSALTEREREVWVRCLPGVTQAEVGREMNLTRTVVCRILRSARGKIQYMGKINALIREDIELFRRFLGMVEGYAGCPNNCPLRKPRFR